MFKIHQAGFWEGLQSSDHHYFDNTLSDSMISFFKEQKTQTILDLGCGMGDYAKSFSNNGLLCDCYDGNPDTPLLSQNRCGCLDLSQKISLNKQYDCVLSLEVGEHIPVIYEDIFIDNIADHAKSNIILSWAVPGQSGDGHVNCRDNMYIIDKLHKYNFKFLPDETIKMRSDASIWWFKNTLMVFSSYV